MFDKWLNLPAHYYLHLTALSLLMLGLPLSNVLMSVGTIWIFANWLLEGKFNNKWSRFKKNTPLQAILILYVLFILSLLWSVDYKYASKDLLNKLPFIVVPLVMGTKEPLKHENYIWLLKLFVLSLVFTTVFNYIYFIKNDFVDIRAMSFFISHIRLGMMLCLAIFLSIFEIYKGNLPKWLLIVNVWLFYYLYFSQVGIAYILFVLLSVVTTFYVIKSFRRKLFAGVLLLFLLLLSVIYINKNYNPNIIIKNTEFEKLDHITANGNSYIHNKKSKLIENGQLVWIYVCKEELENEWNKRAQIKYDSIDAKGQPIYGTILRYLTSKNLRKDSIGVWTLTQEDIRNIEKGKTNFKLKSGLASKINKIYIEYITYIDGGDPNGHSFLQRIEHIKTALQIIKQNGLFGVGVGDVQLEFNKQYEINHTKLKKEHWLRAHNQLITIWLTIGVLGFIIILYILLEPFFNKNISYPTLIVMVTLIFGFLTQDILETQAGVTLFAVFYALLNNHQLYGKNR
jgi:hypothetical protein